jgi:hypothetical protein
MNDEYNIKREDWISSREVFRPKVFKKNEPRVDETISNLVGKKIYSNDKRLINKLVEWKRKKNPDEMDNFLQDSSKVEELRKALA